MQKLLAGIFALLVFSPIALANAPSWWSEQTVKQSGSIITVQCQGEGAERALSYSAAVSECRSIVSAHLRDTKWRVQSLSISTEKDLGYHAQEEMHAEVTDVQGKVLNEYSEKMPDGSSVTYIQYRADVSKAKVKNLEEEPSKDAPTGLIQSDAGPFPTTAKQAASYRSIERGRNRLLLVNIYPSPCDTVLVRGKYPRVVKCEDAPLRLLLQDGDKSAIVRKAGFKPKILKINLDQAADEQEVTNVFLERL